MYSVTKILRKIHATTFTENYGKLRARGMSAWDERTSLPISLGSATRSIVESTETSKTFFLCTRSKPLKIFLRRLLESFAVKQ